MQFFKLKKHKSEDQELAVRIFLLDKEHKDSPEVFDWYMIFSFFSGRTAVQWTRRNSPEDSFVSDMTLRGKIIPMINALHGTSNKIKMSSIKEFFFLFE